MEEIYVKCDHVIPSDIKMGRLKDNEIEVWGEKSDSPVMFVHVCDSCKSKLGGNWASTAQIDYADYS